MNSRRPRNDRGAELPRLSSRPPEGDVEATRLTSLEVAAEHEPVASTRRDKAYLIVLTGSNVGEMFRVEGETVIGRAATAAIRLHDDGISRHHARLLPIGRDVVVEDLGSANGTFVNGELVARQTLHDGDKIRLGSTSILKFTYHDHLDETFQQQMYEAAIRDGLTKAYNKKFFLDRLNAEIAYAGRHRADLSLLMFDVDHFKRVNDTYGHPVGDGVLVKLAKIARATVRTEDVFARYGGEEFVVICRGIALANAGVVAERLRAVIEQFAFEFDGKRIPVTVSIGVAAHADVPGGTAEQLVVAADEALYEAKRTGRNRVVLMQRKK